MRMRPTVYIAGLIRVLIPALLLMSAPEMSQPSTLHAQAGPRGQDLTGKPAQAQVQPESEAQAEPEAQPEKIFAGPKDIKERIAVYVFLGWLWLSTAVLIYLLRLKIREIDRLHEFSYFTADRGKGREE